jgi:hypothetical protein
MQLRDKCTVSAKKTLENTQAKYVAIAEVCRLDWTPSCTCPSRSRSIRVFVRASVAVSQTNKHIHEERMAESERNKAVIEVRPACPLRSDASHRLEFRGLFAFAVPCLPSSSCGLGWVQTTNKELDEYLQNKRVQRQESSRKLAELKTQQAEQTRLQNRIDFLLHRKLNKQHREQTRSEAEQLEEEQEQLRVKLNDMYEEQRNRKAHLQNLALGGNAAFAL